MDKFRELRELARYTREPKKRNEGRERLIRFLDSCSGTKSLAPILDSLCIHFGLFPYVSPMAESLSTPEALALENHRPPGELLGTGFTFHSDQAKVFHRLMDGYSVILSAPTSFGKSAILDTLVATKKWQNIVVIVPTVALIDEIRRRLIRFGQEYTLVTHPMQEPGKRNIYVLTQERFLEIDRDVDVDLFMIDEFYKLSSASEDAQRTSMLNIAWKRLRDSGAQFYLTGPNIDSLADSLDDELLQSLYVSRYKTVAVDVDDRSHVPDEERIADLEELWETLRGATLVFVSSPTRAERVAVEISEFQRPAPVSDFTRSVAAWLSDNYHPDWRLVKALQKGIAIHSGPMPRSLQRMMVRLFADSLVSTLVCTSTLIEGVNTSAKNVIIYDKKIDRKPIDYFTFSNVQGRAGRMSTHFVGKVVSYMPPPVPTQTEVDIPIESQSPTAPLSSLVQIPTKDLSDGSRARLNDVFEQEDLSLLTIRKNRGYDPANQIAVAERLRASKSLRAKFSWKGFPTNTQLRSVLEVGLRTLLLPKQRRGMSVDRAIGIMNSVRASHGDFGALFDRQVNYRFQGEDESDVISNVMAFQRNWMGFTIPSMLRALQNIYNEVAASAGDHAANYDFYISHVERQFLDANLLSLDEYGLPLPLAMKFVDFGMSQDEDIEVVLKSFRSLATRSDIRAQLSEVESWIVDDVLAGLGVGLDTSPAPHLKGRSDA